MGDLVTISGRTLSQSAQTPASLTFSITEVDHPALRSFGHGNAILINKIDLECTCSGNYAPGQTFTGTGSASIVANTTRVKCEGQSILRQGDNVTITCDGTITETSSGTTSPGSASVTVTITNANQTDIFVSST